MLNSLRGEKQSWSVFGLNQHVQGISAWKTSHKRNSKDPSHLWCPSSGVMSLVFTRRPGESCLRRLRLLLLCLCDVFRAVINSLACWLFECSGPRSVSDFYFVWLVVLIVFMFVCVQVLFQERQWWVWRGCCFWRDQGWQRSGADVGWKDRCPPAESGLSAAAGSEHGSDSVRSGIWLASSQSQLDEPLQRFSKRHPVKVWRCTAGDRMACSSVSNTASSMHPERPRWLMRACTYVLPSDTTCPRSLTDHSLCSVGQCSHKLARGWCCASADQVACSWVCNTVSSAHPKPPRWLVRASMYIPPLDTTCPRYLTDRSQCRVGQRSQGCPGFSHCDVHARLTLVTWILKPQCWILRAGAEVWRRSWLGLRLFRDVLWPSWKWRGKSVWKLQEVLPQREFKYWSHCLPMKMNEKRCWEYFVKQSGGVYAYAHMHII